MIAAETPEGRFAQGKVPGATYEFLPGEIKEVITLSSATPPVPVDEDGRLGLAVPFTTNMNVTVEGTSVVLRDAAGAEVWRTAPFIAWDSAEPSRVFKEPVTTASVRGGALVLRLNATMLGSAAYPIFLDPTWTLSSAVGWGASTFQDAVEDKGDHKVKIGWLADSFDDNTNDQWTTEAGSATFASGVVQLQTSTTVRAGSSWGDQRIGYKIRFTQEGVATLFFRYQDTSNHYFLEMSDTVNQLLLRRTISGTTSTIATMAESILTNTDYTAKVVAAGSYFEVWWASTLKWSGNEASPPGSPPTGPIKFSTNSAARVNVDDVRVWKSSVGTMTTAVRDAGSFRPLDAKVVGTVDPYNQVHVEILSSADNVNWGLWTNVKSDLASGAFHKVPDQDQQRYYRLRVTLTSGTDSTPFLSELTANEGSPPVVTPTTNTGFEHWYPYVGGRVNAVSGNLWFSTGDISVQGRGFALAMVRSYNSLRGSEAGTLGNGWTHSYAQKLVVNADTTVTWNDGDGSQHTFTPKGTTGGYEPPSGVASRLVKNGDATYTLWHVDGTRHWFTSVGRLTSLTDRNGNTLTLTYDGSSRLTTVADDSGKSLTLAYDASNRIQSVTDPLSRQITYGYTGSELTSVRDALGQYENYTYASGKMSAIIDPIGKRTAFTYDGSNRVTEIWLGLYQGGVVAWQFREYEIGYTTTTTRGITNARGYTFSHTLNSFGHAIEVTGPSIGSACCDQRGNSSSYVWDGEMNKIKVTDGRGYAWSMEYDHRGSQIFRTDPGGNVSSSTYGETNTPSQYFVVIASQTNFRGYTTTYAYDGNGNGIKVTNARGGFSENGYDSLGFLNWSSDFRGSKTWYEYNTNRYLTKVTTPASAQTQYGYDAVGRRTTVTAPGGHVTTLVYDADDRVVNVTDPLGNFTRFEYNARGDRTKVIDPNGHATTYAFNVTNRQVRVVTDALANQTTHAYDLRGSLVSVKNARNFVTTYDYDAYDRQWRVTSPLGFATTHAYDAAGNQIGRTDARGQVTTYAYDKLNRAIKVSYPAGSVVTYAYDKNSNPTSEAGFGYTKTMTYDDLDRVTTVAMNYGTFSKTTTYVYDPNGNRIAIRQSDDAYRAIVLRPNGNGGTVQWWPSGCVTNWDCVDEATSDGDTTKVTAGPPGVVDLYAIADVAAGNLPSGDSVISAVTVTAVAKVPTPCEDFTCWAYIRLRANSYESPALGVDEGLYGPIAYTWTTNPATGKRWTEADVNALQAGITLDSTNWLVRVTQVYVTVEVEPTLQFYDAANRLTKVVDPEGQAVVFGYDAKSRRTSTSHPNGVTTTNTYDNADRVTKVETKKSDSTVIEKFEYTYDKAGNRLTMKDNGATTTYTYDKVYRLTKEVTPTGWTTTYTYDQVGNRIQRTSGSLVTEYTYDADDRLTIEHYPSLGWTLTYQYDGNGNLIREVDEIGNPTEYTYDAENRLTRVYYPNSGLNHEYTYTSTGQRMSYASGGSTTYFGYDYYGRGGFEDIVGEYSSSGARQVRYTHGPGADEPLGVLRGGSKYRYHADALGSVTRITDGSQNTAKSYRYDGWGGISSESGSMANPYVFTGREKDAGSTLYYYRARMYDPAVGRFAGKDPSGTVDGTNLYAYAGGNPVNRIDPSGMHFAGCSGWECRLGGHDHPTGGSSPPPGSGIGQLVGGGVGATQQQPKICTNWGKVSIGIALVAIAIGLAALLIYGAIITGGTLLEVLIILGHFAGFFLGIIGVIAIGISLIADGLDDPC